jgi:hypothetical protein
MSVRKKQKEISRLIEAFEVEAEKFHDLIFSIYYLTQEDPDKDAKFHDKNHAIMLWQYHGLLGENLMAGNLAKDVVTSDLQWGIRGAELSSFGVLEGDSVQQFVRMAKRAGSLFSEKETREIQNRVNTEIIDKLSPIESGKPVVVVNTNELSIWLNYLLYHLSLEKPWRAKAAKIEPDPYTLSLLALEKLFEDSKIDKSDRSLTKVSDIQFKVSLSFPGEKRVFVSKVVDSLKKELGNNAIFYDYDYQSQLAVPDLDSKLQDIYRNKSDLVVVFLCKEYSFKEWCGLEWRAVKDIIKSKKNQKIMFIRFDEAKIDGVFSIDGYVDANQYKPAEIAEFILQRVELNGVQHA